MKVSKRRIVGTLTVALLLVSGGAALAASDLLDPEKTAREIIASAAEKLGVGDEELRDALQSASAEQVDAALEAGVISRRQALAMKDMIEAGRWPFLGVPGRNLPRVPERLFGPLEFGPPFHPGLFEAAADYLGLTREGVRARLTNGRTLAEIARAEDESVSGLIDALNARHRAALQTEVEAGRLTEAQRDKILECTEQRIRELVHLGLRARRLRPPFLRAPSSYLGAPIWWPREMATEGR
jgi:hypothetical protein